MAERTTAAVWVKGIAEMLAAEGLDVRAVRGNRHRRRRARYSRRAPPDRTYQRFMELAVERSGNPALALAQHQVARPASFDVVGYTMMSCADLRGAFERLIRYMLSLSDALTMTISEEAGAERITFVLFGAIGRYRGSASSLFPSASSASVAGSADAISVRARSNLPIRAIRPRALPRRFSLFGVIRRAPPQHSVRAGRHDGAAADVQSAARRTARTLRRRLSAPIRSRSNQLSRARGDCPPLARRRAAARRGRGRTMHERAHAAAAAGDGSHVVRRAIGRNTTRTGGAVSRPAQLSLAQAAYMLGFADQRSFFRACKRWFKLSPGQYRDELYRLASGRAY